MVLLNLIALNCLSLIIKLLFPLFVLEKSFFEFSSVWYKCTIKKKKKNVSRQKTFFCVQWKPSLNKKHFLEHYILNIPPHINFHVTKKSHNINFYLSIASLFKDRSLIYHWIFFSMDILFKLVSFSLFFFFSCKF